MRCILEYRSIHELGQRSNQEDSLFPPAEGIDDNHLYLVCDGMGGHDNGEMASAIVCEAISRYILENYNPEDTFTDEIFNAALNEAYDLLDQNDMGGEKKMGTTMTFLYFHRDGCFAAHIGDSRIYHIRPSVPLSQRIQYVSRDHSLVNDLLAVGELTEEEALNFRYKNVITRSMQPGLERRPRAEVRRIDDIRAGDYFFMCSDGILEQLDDMTLADIISEKGVSDEYKIGRLVKLTEENKDNHTAHLIHVMNVKGGNHKSGWLQSSLWLLLILLLTFLGGMMFMRHRHMDRMDQLIQQDIRNYQEIFHQIDSLEQNSAEHPKLVDIYWLCREAALIEDKHRNKYSEFDVAFNRRASEKADSVMVKMKARQSVIKQFIREKQQEIDEAMRELSAIESTKQ